MAPRERGPADHAIENYAGNLPVILEHGLIGAGGDGLISAAARADFAEAAAAVVAGEGHENRVYELGGTPFTLTRLAAEISRRSGREVRYTNLPEEACARALTGAGLRKRRPPSWPTRTAPPPTARSR